MSAAESIRDEFPVVLMVCAAFLTGFLVGDAERVPAPAPLPTPPAEAGAENHPRIDDRSASSARSGFTFPRVGMRGANLPAGADVTRGARIERESAAVPTVPPAAGRESNFQTIR